MNKIPIVLILCFFFSCYKSKKEEGFKIIIEFTLPKSFKIEFTENDFKKIDWVNQEYYFEEDVLNNLSIVKKAFLKDELAEIFLNSMMNYGACTLKTFLHGDLEYEAVVYFCFAPVSRDTTKNMIEILGKESKTLIYKNKLQLNINSRKERPRSFLYNIKIMKYLNEKLLLK